MPTILELNCCIPGDHRHTWALEIEATKSVGNLKEAIKEKQKHVFDHVDADTLVLWRVSIPDERLEENITGLDFDETKQLLSVKRSSFRNLLTNNNSMSLCGLHLLVSLA
jgi:hypothetical protein